MEREQYNNLLNNLKSKYQDAYLALATKEEIIEFIRLFAIVSHIPEDIAKVQIKKTIEIQKVNLVYKPYLEYKNSLESRLGVYYFVKLNTSERDKLLDLYTKYKKVKEKGYTKDMAFLELYNLEEEKYERIRVEAENNLKNLKSMIAYKQIGIDELLKK